MRYLYVTRYDEMLAATASAVGPYRHLKVSAERGWRNATTGLYPLDAEIKKALHYGYSHHIVRLMVFLSLFIMCGIHPNDIYKWFMEVVAIDAYDWVMVGNIWAMGYFYKGAMSRPYVSSSAYIARMSDYEKDGKWDVIWDALFYRFCARSEDAVAYKRNLAHIDAAELKRHIGVADEFINGMAKKK